MKTTAAPRTDTSTDTLWRCGGRQCGAGECEHEENELHRHASGPGGPRYAPPVVHDVLRTSGSPLPTAVRTDMEKRLGHHLADVRIHTDTAAAQSARAVDASAYTVGTHVVFGPGGFDPSTPTGRHLLAHELAHVAQQRRASVGPSRSLRVSDPSERAEREADATARAMTAGAAPTIATAGEVSQSVQRARCALVPAATCAAPVAGSAEDFSAAEEAAEVSPRARRARMTPARQTSTGHTGRGRQLELILEAEAPGLLANVHGIFLDRDMSPGTGALVSLCSDMTPPVAAPAGRKCVFVPATLNREARRFREGNAVVGGQPREDWHVQTMQTLIHEIEHVVFDAAGLGQPVGASAAACPRANVEFELSELAAIMSEFPTAFRAIPVGAGAGHASRTRLSNWFTNALTNPFESIEGALTKMRCACDCTEVDAFVRQTFNHVAASWTPGERTVFNTRLQAEAGLHWPL